MSKYGYIRVSTKEQNTDRQLTAMMKLDIPSKNIFIDKSSGKDFNRKEYQKLIKIIKRNDIIFIKSIDRLGRNYREILEQWEYITKVKEVHINVLDMPLLNTDAYAKDLTGVFVSDLVLNILAYVAETERAFIRQRQAEGIAIAKSKGVKFGCKRKELPIDFDYYYNLWNRREISLREAAKKMNMNYSTFYRRCKEYDQLNK